MAQYVTPEIAEIRDDPHPDQFIELVLVVDEESASNIRNRVEAHSGDVLDDLGSGVLIVDLPETELDEFCATDILNSVSERNRMQVLS